MAEQNIDKLLDNIEGALSDSFIYAGVLDDNAKLINFRKGKRVRFNLPSDDRQQTAAIQISLTFTILRQFEDIAGQYRYSFARFAKHDILLVDTLSLHLFVIIKSLGSMNQLTQLLEMVDKQQGKEETLKETSSLGPASSSNSAQPKSYIPPGMEAHKENQEPPKVEKIDPSKVRRPESIIMLQGFLKGFAFDYTIEHGEDLGEYKIKANETNGFTWMMIDKINIAFGNQIAIHSIAKDIDGKPAIKIFLKEVSNNDKMDNVPYL